MTGRGAKRGGPAMQNISPLPKLPKGQIYAHRLAALAFTNSALMPQVVNASGRRKRWVGIGWVDEGPAKSDEVEVVHAVAH